LHSQQLLQLVFFQFPHKNAFPIFHVAGGVKTGAFLWRGHQGQCAKHHHSTFHHVQEVRNYLGLLPYNELFLP
jgi:hypothetical protein